MIDLAKIKLGVSELTNTIYLYRYGKDENVVLDKREAYRDVLRVITTLMMQDMDKGATVEYCFGDQWYELSVKEIDTPKGKQSKKDNTK